MRRALLLFGTLAMALAAPPPARAADAWSLHVKGDLPDNGSLTLAQIKAMPADTARWMLHGKEHVVIGVPLDSVLRRFGFEPGAMGKDVQPADKRNGYKKVVLVRAEDGFLAVFSAAEIMGGMGATRALLVWSDDGKPIVAGEGPVRLAVVTDQEGSRSAHRPVEIEVMDIRLVHRRH